MGPRGAGPLVDCGPAQLDAFYEASQATPRIPQRGLLERVRPVGAYVQIPDAVVPPFF